MKYLQGKLSIILDKDANPLSFMPPPEEQLQPLLNEPADLSETTSNQSPRRIRTLQERRSIGFQSKMSLHEPHSPF